MKPSTRIQTAGMLIAATLLAFPSAAVAGTASGPPAIMALSEAPTTLTRITFSTSSNSVFGSTQVVVRSIGDGASPGDIGIRARKFKGTALCKQTIILYNSLNVPPGSDYFISTGPNFMWDGCLQVAWRDLRLDRRSVQHIRQLRSERRHRVIEPVARVSQRAPHSPEPWDRASFPCLQGPATGSA